MTLSMRRLLLFALMWTAVAGAESLPPSASSVKYNDQSPPVSPKITGKRKRITRPFAVFRRAARAEVNLAVRLSSWGMPSTANGK